MNARRWAGATIGLLAVLFLLVMLVPFDPDEQRPGARLSGTSGTADEWQNIANDRRAFGDNLVHLETRPWYLIRHSVTTTSMTRDGEFYVPCGNCVDKGWPKNVARDPTVRVRIGDRLFERHAHRVTDEADLVRLLGAETVASRPSLWLFRLDPPA